MAWVAVIGGATTLGAAAIKASSSQGSASGGSGFMGGMGQTDASSATYGTTIGDDGWSINFGSGSQVATPTKTTNETYSDAGMTQSQPNPLTGLTQQTPRASSSSGYGTSSGLDTQTLLLLAVGGFMLLRR